MDWQQLRASITGSVDEELLLRNEYLVTENRILRQQLTGRVQLSDAERRSLAEIGKKLGKRALEEVYFARIWLRLDESPVIELASWCRRPLSQRALDHDDDQL